MHLRKLAVASALALSSCAGRQAPPPIATGTVLHSSIRAHACETSESCRVVFSDEFSSRLPLVSGEIRGGEAIRESISRQLSTFYGFRKSERCNDLVKGSAFVIVRESAEFRFLRGNRVVGRERLLEEDTPMLLAEFCQQQEEKGPEDDKDRHRQFNDLDRAYAFAGRTGKM
ncbi:MAG: hypothetical protein AB1529_03100 [Candidatus Micrarchaeota archaeon]